MLKVPEDPMEYTWCFPDNASQILITGVLFTDGALRGLHPEARRGGWAFAMMGAERGELKEGLLWHLLGALAHSREGRVEGGGRGG